MRVASFIDPGGPDASTTYKLPSTSVPSNPITKLPAAGLNPTFPLIITGGTPVIVEPAIIAKSFIDLRSKAGME